MIVGEDPRGERRVPARYHPERDDGKVSEGACGSANAMITSASAPR